MSLFCLVIYTFVGLLIYKVTVLENVSKRQPRFLKHDLDKIREYDWTPKKYTSETRPDGEKEEYRSMRVDSTLLLPFVVKPWKLS